MQSLALIFEAQKKLYALVTKFIEQKKYTVLDKEPLEKFIIFLMRYQHFSHFRPSLKEIAQWYKSEFPKGELIGAANE